jgi:hypothetical protein
LLGNSIIKRLLPLISSLFLDSLLQYLSLKGIASPKLSFGATRQPRLD